jgi:hypothetical protein
VSELEKYLHSLGGEGEEGAFTVNYQAAFRKLREFQLGSNHDTLSCLVMSAVAAGACTARIVQNKSEAYHTFSHDGGAPERVELGQLFSHLLGSDESLRYLAIAVNRSLASKNCRTVVWSPDGRFDFSWSGVEQMPESSKGFRCRMNGYYGDGVFQTLSKKARFAPLALSCEGRLLNAPDAEGDQPIAACLKLYNPGPAGDHFAVAADYGRGRTWTELSPRSNTEESRSAATVSLTEDQEILHCEAVIAMTEDPTVDSQLHFFRHGVEICKMPFRYRDGLVVLLGSEGLQLDLSSHQIVMDRNFQELLVWVDEQAERLARRLKNSYPHLDLKTRLKAARLRY